MARIIIEVSEKVAFFDVLQLNTEIGRIFKDYVEDVYVDVDSPLVKEVKLCRGKK